MLCAVAAALSLCACGTTRSAQGGQTEASLEQENRALAAALPQKRAEAKRAYEEATAAEAQTNLAAASCTFVAPASASVPPPNGAGHAKVVLQRTTFVLVPRPGAARSMGAVRSWPATCEEARR